MSENETSAGFNDAVTAEVSQAEAYAKGRKRDQIRNADFMSRSRSRSWPDETTSVEKPVVAEESSQKQGWRHNQYHPSPFDDALDRD